MVDLDQLYETVVCELKVLQESNGAKSYVNSTLGFPQFLSVYGNRTIEINDKMSDAIRSIARHFWKANPSLKSTIKKPEWETRARRLFGKPLSRLDLSLSNQELASTLKTDISLKMIEMASVQPLELEHVFATTWLDTPNFRCFDLGPVKIETRQLWLNRMLGVGSIDKVAFRRVSSKWKGNKLNDRNPSASLHSEGAAIDIVGKSPFVISVSTKNCSGDISYQRARRAAHLLMMSIALFWELPSKTLLGLNLKVELGPTRRIQSIILENRMMSNSYSMVIRPTGPRLEFSDWEKMLEDNKGYFALFSDIANTVADPKYNCSNSSLVVILALALNWFYEACSSDDELMAITHFASCLDTLGMTSGSGGIFQMIENQLGWKKTDTISVDGDTIKQIVNNIYSDGRSRFLHGTTNEQFDDWSETRTFAEVISRHCLNACLDALQKDRSITSFK